MRAVLPVPCGRVNRCGVHRHGAQGIGRAQTQPSRAAPARGWARSIAATALAIIGVSCVGPTRPRPTAQPTLPALRVATSADYAPFSSDRAGTLQGMDVDIAERLARDLGMQLEYVRFGWPQLAAATQQGGFDVAMSGVTMRPERALIGRYTRPYALVGSVALVRSDDAHTQSLDALDRADVRIAVNAGGHLERVARMRFPAASIEPVTDNQAVMRRLADGKADAVVTDTAELQEWTRPGVRALGPFSVDHKAYLLPADRGDLAARLDAWMAAREADGWLDAERVRWLGRAASMDPDAADREAVVSLIQLRLALMPDVAATKQAAGMPIEDRAQEARVIERVRARSARPEATAAVYVQLIELAKAVQRGAPAAPSRASLDELRAALGRIDEQLVRELDRTPRGSPDEWRTSLARSLDDLPIDPTAVEELVSVLTNRDAAT